MKSELVTGRVWSAIHAAADRARGRKLAAVAYIGPDGADLLSDFGAGDLLVCNMGKSALRSGSTHPDAIEKLIDRGVQVRTHERLHAKVYVLGSVALVGSANCSSSAANYLIEAVTRTTAREFVADARRFVLSTHRDALPVTRDFLKLARKVFRRPRGGTGGRSARVGKPEIRLHVEEYVGTEPPKLVEAHYQSNRDDCQAKAGPPSKWYMDISWDPDARSWLRDGDWVLWIGEDSPEVLPPMKFLDRVPVGGRSSQFVTWYRAANKDRLPLDRVKSRVLSNTGYRIRPGRLVNTAAAVDAIFALWNLSPHD